MSASFSAGSAPTQVDSAQNDPAALDPAQPATDELLEELRLLLLDKYRGQVEVMQTNLDHLRSTLIDVEEQINDQDALVTTIKPVIADAIGASIHESRDEMVDALYPIMGRLVSRAVAESIRDLARSIDAQMRSAFSFRSIIRRTKARASGVSDSALLLRDAMPYQVVELFLIHREQGLLLAHASGMTSPTQSRTDSEIVGSMLTAIREFAADSFGRGKEGSLDEVQYGDLHIVMETTALAYLAAIVQGVASHDLREQMRSLLIEAGRTHKHALRTYDGDATRFRDVEMQMMALLSTPTGAPPTVGAPARSAQPVTPPALGSRQPVPAPHRLPVSVTIVFILCALTLVLFLWRLVAIMTGSPA